MRASSLNVSINLAFFPLRNPYIENVSYFGISNSTIKIPYKRVVCYSLLVLNGGEARVARADGCSSLKKAGWGLFKLLKKKFSKFDIIIKIKKILQKREIFFRGIFELLKLIKKLRVFAPEIFAVKF